MEKMNHYIIQFAKYFSPFAAIAVVMDLMGYNTRGQQKTLINYMFDIVGWGTMVWCVAVFYLFFAIAFNEKLKNSLIRWMAGIRENDERETYLTGQISKKTFITTTSLLILLLFLSALQVVVYQIPEAKRTPDKNGEIRIGMGFPLLADSTPTVENNEDPDKIYLINYKGLPLTSGSTFLLITVLQMGVFYFYSRKELKKSEA